MSQKANNTKLGLFILTGATLFVVTLVVLGAGSFFERRLEFETYFDTSVQGLSEGSPVKLRGVTIGEVTEICFIEDHYPDVADPEGQFVLIRMEIMRTGDTNPPRELVAERIRAYVQEGLRLRLASQGITGLSFLEAEYMGPDAPTAIEVDWEPEVVYIPSAPNQFRAIAGSIESIARDLQEARISQIARNLDDLTLLAKDRLEDLDVERLQSDTIAALDRGSATLERIDAFLTHPDLESFRADLPETSERLKRALDQLDVRTAEASEDLGQLLVETREAVTTFRAELAGESPDGLGASIRRLTGDLGVLARRLDTLALSIEDFITANENDVRQSTTELRDLVAQMRNLTENLSRYPSLALFGEAPQRLEVYE